MSEEKQEKQEKKQTFYWNGVGTYGADVKKGEVMPDNFSEDPRKDGWLKDGTVTTSEPDMSAELKDAAELLKMEIAELTEKNAALQGISKKLVAAEAENEKLNKKVEKLEKAYASIQDKAAKIAAEVVQKLQDDSMSRKEKNDAAKLLGGLLNG